MIWLIAATYATYHVTDDEELNAAVLISGVQYDLVDNLIEEYDEQPFILELESESGTNIASLQYFSIFFPKITILFC